MIWFVIVAGLLTVTALATILEPIIRQPRSGAEEKEPVATLFRRQLAAIDEELTEGRVTPDQAGAFRIEITRGLLAAANREPATSDAPTRRPAEICWRFGIAIAIAGLLPARLPRSTGMRAQRPPAHISRPNSAQLSTRSRRICRRRRMIPEAGADEPRLANSRRLNRGRRRVYGRK